MEENPVSEFATVLYMDIVGYSLLSLEEQVRQADVLRQVVRRVLGSALRGPLSSISIDSGDGVATVFFGDPKCAIECTERIAGELRDEGLSVRSGVHCGPVVRSLDVRNQPTVSGPGINLAQRVMAFADPGQVLLSEAAADVASAFESWRDQLVDFGQHEAKHGTALHIYGLGDPLRGRPELPERLKKEMGHANTRGLHFFTEPDRPFVGRRLERETLQELIESQRSGLVTLTGPGGIGKTRLALEVARHVAPNFAEGAWLVECDALTSSQDLLAKLASVFSLGLSQPTAQEIGESLQDRNLLIVADCFEGISKCAPILDEIASRAPEVHFLVTSRVLLGLSRERELPIGPLSTIRDKGATADAVALFVSAARAALPSFRLTRQNREIVESIVGIVEAVPLALVLAAGRLRLLSLAELQTQLERRPLEILKRKSVGNDRHANLERVVEDSFALLDEELRSLLVSLSVFRGGFGLADAEAVVGQGRRILDGISDLRDNSLLTASSSDGITRYRALDVVAEYIENISRERVDEGLRLRHAAYFSERALRLRELYDSGSWKEANLGLGSELGNYRRAIDFAIEHKNSTLLRSYCASLCRLLMEAGFRSDFDRLSEAGAKVAETEGDLALLIEITGLQGGVRRRDHDIEGATRFWRLRAAYCQEALDFDREADSWLDLADMAVVFGQPEQAKEPLERFAELEPQLSDGLIMASGNAARAKFAILQGQADDARELADRALGLAENLPHRMHSFYVWMSLAEIYASLGEAERSIQICREAICETVLGRHYSYTGLLLCRLASVLDEEGEIEVAAESLSIAAAIPKAVSQTLREQVKNHKDAFVRKHGPQFLAEAARKTGGMAWTTAAMELAERPKSMCLEGKDRRNLGDET